MSESARAQHRWLRIPYLCGMVFAIGILHASRMMRAGNGGRLRCPVSLSKDDTLVGFVGRGRVDANCAVSLAVLLTVLVIWVVGYP
jgi:hypothetical protein